jgi:hypothetical protein
MAVAYWTDRGLFVNEAMKKLRTVNPSAVQDLEQEFSPYEPETFIDSDSG